MKKSILKIVTLLLVIGLNWTGLLAIGRTIAYFSDTENGSGNTYQSGTLDFSLRSGQGNFISPAENMKPGNSTARDIYIKKEGTLPFKYRAHSEFIPGSCDEDLYNILELKIWYNWYDDIGTKHMELKYQGSLKDFETNPGDIELRIPNDHPYFPNPFYSEDEHWFYFWIQLPLGVSETFQNKTCQFKFVFEGWQDNIENYEDGGFTDREEISNIISSDYRQIVLNEFLPNPEGDDGQNGLQGEWVELYNNGTEGVDLTDWYIDIESGYGQTISSENTWNGRTLIGVLGSGLEWVVVFMNGAILDNTGDTVILYDKDYNKIDEYTFGVSANDDDSDSNNTPAGDNENPAGDETPGNEGKSYARIPDGVGDWVDPIPTPGGPNVLDNKDDITFSELVEEFMDSNEGTGDLIEELEELEEPMDIEIITEPEISTVSELPEDSIIETTTPSTEEVIVIEEEPEPELEPEQETGEIKEEIIQEESLIEEEIPTGEEEILEEEAVVEEEEPVMEEPVEGPTPEEVLIEDPQPEPLKEPDPEPEPEPEPEFQPEADPPGAENNNDNIENE